jgi:hypothetical protein
MKFKNAAQVLESIGETKSIPDFLNNILTPCQIKLLNLRYIQNGGQTWYKCSQELKKSISYSYKTKTEILWRISAYLLLEMKA